jgi:hypothetical protein
MTGVTGQKVMTVTPWQYAGKLALSKPSASDILVGVQILTSVGKMRQEKSGR